MTLNEIIERACPDLSYDSFYVRRAVREALELAHDRLPGCVSWAEMSQVIRALIAELEKK